MMSLVQDLETQRRGFIVIQWFHNINIFDDFSTRGKVHSTLKDCIPFRIGALHICIPEQEELKDSNLSKSSTPSHSTTPTNIIKSMFALAIGAELRPKLRIHTGKFNLAIFSLFSSFLFLFLFLFSSNNVLLLLC